MSSYPQDLWQRAIAALGTAKHLLAVDPDATASRAYYAAFYAVSAYFALEGKTFTRHSAVEAAVHRDLVKAGVWPSELGTKYSRLAELRRRGDYGGADHVLPDEASEAVEAAAEILQVVAGAKPGDFVLSEHG